MTNTYTEPVSKLLKLGRPVGKEWLDYLALDITRDQIPELMRLVEDRDLFAMEAPDDLPDGEDLPEWYAQIHAWRALAQLKAEEAIPVILGMFHEIDDEDNDWIEGDVDGIFALIGPSAISPLAEYLADDTHGAYARTTASESLRSIATTYPETRGECLKHIVAVLEKYEHNDEGLNGFVIHNLVQLQAVEHIALIEKAFASNHVDEFIMGDFEDVQIELGLIEERVTPRRRMSLLDNLPRADEVAAFERKVQKEKAKEKNKRKQEKKSRKKNRKKK